MMDISTVISQGQGEKTLTKFAEELELSHSILSLVKNGKRPAGGKVIMALLRHPDTRQQMLVFLAKNVTEGDIISNEGEQ